MRKLTPEDQESWEAEISGKKPFSSKKARAEKLVKISYPSEGIEPSILQRLREGKLPIQARLDLHGLTQAVAFEALQAFIHQHYTAQRRYLLVITGKGSGILKTEAPRWLQLPEFAEMVIGFAESALRHGGSGALYLVLRKQKPVPRI